jgi:UDP-N-acetylglucosamine 2-epimerase
VKTVLSVVGTRPQFVKVAPLSRRLRGQFREVLVHTGQHYDRSLSDAFFAELGIPAPEVNLGVGSLGHAEQTARMTDGIEAAIRRERPDVVVIVGDTNSTLAGALAAQAAGTPLAHVEAGLRCGDRGMPEEVNRIAADHLSDLRLCPTRGAVANLEAEGIDGVFTGDVMLETCLAARERADGRRAARLGVEPGGYYLATIHRAENTEHSSRLLEILRALGRLDRPVVFPIHPRTATAMEWGGVVLPENVRATEPLSHRETMGLLADAAKVLTDSGGLQKEAYFLGVPCVTIRDSTEWTETVEAGWNRLAVTEEEIVAAATAPPPEGAGPDTSLFGDADAATRIVDEIARLVA